MNPTDNTPETTEQLEVFAFEGMKSLVRQALHLRPQNLASGQLPLFGFERLDQITGGLKPARLYSLVTKPGTGKTAFMLTIVNNLAVKNNFSVAIFSAERTGVKIAQRLIESETGISLGRLDSGKLKDSDRDRFHTLLSCIEKSNILVHHSKALNVDEIVVNARDLANSKYVDVIIVDFLEMVASNESNLHPDDRIAKTVFALKELSVELNIPILLLSQQESRNRFFQKPAFNETPIALTEISDTILLLHRKTISEIASNGVQKNVKIIVSKSPEIDQPVEVTLNFIETTDKFVDF